jgi:hypothetical protein
MHGFEVKKKNYRESDFFPSSFLTVPLPVELHKFLSIDSVLVVHISEG